MLNKHALLIYLIVIIFFNFAITNFGLVTISASFEIQDLLEQHNEERASAGLGKLEISGVLSRSANEKGEAMLASNCWSHYCPDGKDWRDFFFDQGYDYLHAGENLAEGFGTSDGVMNAWMNSKSHRENIMNPNFTEVGFGLVTGNYQGKSNNTIIVVHFGKPVSNALQVADSIEVDSQSEDAFINIEYPVNESAVNTNSIDIGGAVFPENSEVLLEINGDENGRVWANGDNYSFRPVGKLLPGDNTLQTKVITQFGQSLAESEFIVVRLDENKPYLVTEETKAFIDETESIVSIQIETNEPVRRIVSDVPVFELNKTEEKVWRFKVNANGFSNGVTLTLTDEAGNSSTAILSKTFIDNLITDPSNSFDFERTELDKVEAEILGGFFSNFSGDDPRFLFVTVFTLYLLVLVLIDFFVLFKTDMLHVTRSKSHLHIATITVFFLFLIVGGGAGGILTGVNAT